MKMKKCFYSIVLAFVMILAACGADTNEQPNEEPNNKSEAKANNSEEKNQPSDIPQENDDRIITTTVALTEIMDALDLDLIGVPKSYKELPERYEGLPEVGFGTSMDMEMILSLKPTEVLAVTVLQGDLESTFSDAGVTTSYVDLNSIDGMHESILEIGERYNRVEEAEEIVRKFSDKVSEIEAVAADKESPSVLILLGVPGSYLVATEHSYIGDLVRKSGGVNVVSGETVDYLASNTEYLYQSNPDIILRAAHGMPDEVVKMFKEEFKTNDIWKHFDAVKNDRVYDLEETLFGTTGNLAAIDALDELLNMLYFD